MGLDTEDFVSVFEVAKEAPHWAPIVTSNPGIQVRENERLRAVPPFLHGVPLSKELKLWLDTRGLFPV